MGMFSRGGVSAAEFRREVALIQRDIQDLREAIESLHAKHLKLRGTVYAHKMHKADLGDSPRTMTKDDLRRSLVKKGRFVPGRPAVHDDMTGDDDGD